MPPTRREGDSLGFARGRTTSSPCRGCLEGSWVHQGDVEVGGCGGDGAKLSHVWFSFEEQWPNQ